MKTEIKKVHPSEPIVEYPVLMISTNVENKNELVVLFVDECSGTVIHTSDPTSKVNRVGEYSSSWIECTNEEYWTRLDGKVTLSN